MAAAAGVAGPAPQLIHIAQVYGRRSIPAEWMAVHRHSSMQSLQLIWTHCQAANMPCTMIQCHVGPEINSLRNLFFQIIAANIIRITSIILEFEPTLPLATIEEFLAGLANVYNIGGPALKRLMLSKPYGSTLALRSSVVSLVRNAPRLEGLILNSFMIISAEGWAEALTRSPVLWEIVFEKMNINAEVALMLQDIWPHLNSLRKLSIGVPSPKNNNIEANWKTALSTLAACPSITQFTFNSKLTPSASTIVTGILPLLPNLRHLQMEFALNLDADSVAALCTAIVPCIALQTLWFENMGKHQDVILATAATLPNITRLILGGLRTTSAAWETIMASLSQCQMLKSITLRDVVYSNAGNTRRLVETLAALPHLQILHLHRSSLLPRTTNEFARVLPTMPALEVLDIEQCQLALQDHPAFVQAIKTCTSLHTLKLNGMTKYALDVPQDASKRNMAIIEDIFAAVPTLTNLIVPVSPLLAPELSSLVKAVSVRNTQRKMLILTLASTRKVESWKQSSAEDRGPRPPIPPSEIFKMTMTEFLL
jgi:hypothetical protein